MTRNVITLLVVSAMIIGIGVAIAFQDRQGATYMDGRPATSTPWR